MVAIENLNGKPEMQDLGSFQKGVYSLTDSERVVIEEKSRMDHLLREPFNNAYQKGEISYEEWLGHMREVNGRLWLT